MAIEEETQAPLWMFKAAAALCVLFAGLAVALAVTSPREPAPSATLAFDRPQLVVFESASCVWCRRFRERVAPVYERSPLDGRAPLRYVNVSNQRSAGYRLAYRVNATPTFVLVDTKGREVSRLRGVTMATGLFQKQVEDMLAKLPAETSLDAPPHPSAPAPLTR